jgi:hypothetical protein
MRQAPVISQVKRLLDGIDNGKTLAAAQLLHTVYDELRRLAAQKLAQEQPGHTLEPTVLVNEASLRLAGNDPLANLRQCFAAAATAIERILIDRTRQRQSPTGISTHEASVR